MTSASLVLRAAQPWSAHTHCLFPAPARECARALLSVGYQLAWARPHCEGSGAMLPGEAFLDVWRDHIMPRVVLRASTTAR